LSGSSAITGSYYNFQITAGGGGVANSFWFDATNDGVFIWVPVTGAFDARCRVRVRNNANTANPPTTSFRIAGLAFHDVINRSALNYLHGGFGSTGAGGLIGRVEWKTTDEIDGGSTDTSAFNSVPFASGDLDGDLRIVRRASNLQIFDIYWTPTTASIPLTQVVNWRSLITVNRNDNATPPRSTNGATANIAVPLPISGGIGFTVYSNVAAHDIRMFVEEFSLRRYYF